MFLLELSLGLKCTWRHTYNTLGEQAGTEAGNNWHMFIGGIFIPDVAHNLISLWYLLLFGLTILKKNRI